MSSDQYAADYNEVKSVGALASTTRTPDQTEAALFWLPGIQIMCNDIARIAAAAHHNSLLENARLFALLNLAAADTTIAVMDTKYTYNFWRPREAIHAGDTDGNDDTIADATWTPLTYIGVHPDYVSQHAAVGGAAAQVLAHFFGTDDFNFSITTSTAPGGVFRSYRTHTNLLITPVPQPTGPYPVGTLSRLLTDPSRTNAVRHTNQQFMITFWYPAVAQAEALPAPYVEKQLAQNSTVYESFVNRVPEFFSHSSSNAPLATNQVKWPVLLYSPALTRHRRECTDKTEELASWGYIIVGMDHRDTDLSVFPSGNVVFGSSDTSSAAALRAQLDGAACWTQNLRWTNSRG